MPNSLAQNYPHLEISVLKLSEVLHDNPTKRMDAEYFKREWVGIKNKLLSVPNEYLRNLVSFNARYSQPTYDQNSQLKIINSQHVRNEYINHENARTGYGAVVPREAILINSTGVGTLGRVFINLLDFDFSVDNHINILVVKDYKKLLPGFLMVFLQTKFGQAQINRYYSGTSGQIEIYPRNFNNFLIPLLPLDFQEHIAQLVKNAHACLEQSKALYKEAQGLLEQELGTPPKAPPKEHQIKSLKESFLSTGRLDAEFYQSKYEHLETCLREYVNGVVPLKDLVHEYSSGFAFKSVDYLDQQQPNALMLIRINNIKRNTLDTQNVIYLPAQAKELSPKDKLQKGDLLISMSGSIGLACVVHTEIEAMLNQRILKIRVKNFIPEVLALYLNSVMGRLQFERIGTGGVQTNLSYADMQNIFVPKIPLNVQEQIAALLQESLKHREQAKVLLTQAKARAEHALTGGGGGNLQTTPKGGL
ncbi:restriction endonuclease subunit S [Helicobacter ailurogastricus]|uniref:restriction endonuclease subunit S n=1 Tax=Helicobacter ailurogastricus TaxID=1578720 RepID=UPI000CF116CD|nr:restriction endonuclease subunit S [Helicobacter ailurogastricus]